MEYDLVTWLFWLGVAEVLAAEAALQALVCTFGLVTFWAIYRTYMSG